MGIFLITRDESNNYSRHVDAAVANGRDDSISKA
jgi:hypothetical protein